MAKLAGIPSQVENRARELLRNLEKTDNILEDTLENDKLLNRKIEKSIKDSKTSETSSEVEMPAITPQNVQVETELSKALLLLNPESITPLQALEIIYDLQKKAQKRST